MISKYSILNAQVIDIETASKYATFSDFQVAEPKMALLFEKKMKNQVAEKMLQPMHTYQASGGGGSRSKTRMDSLEEVYTEKAALYAEFARVVCVSRAKVVEDAETKKTTVKTVTIKDDSEAEILRKLASALNKSAENREFFLIGHNLIGFDIPFLCKRYLINGMEIPKTLDITGLKPWEIKHTDSMRLWSFGAYEMTSFDLMATSLGVETKTIMDGSDVGRYFWIQKDVESIAKYCEEDVEKLAEVMMNISV